jgi:hypothetical protein
LVAPGVQTPVHAPFTQAWFEHAVLPVHAPVALQLWGVRLFAPLHCT